MNDIFNDCVFADYPRFEYKTSTPTYRECKGRYYEYKQVGNTEYENEVEFNNGKFHCWGTYNGNTVAIVELERGKIIFVKVEDFKFTDCEENIGKENI